MPSVEDLIKAGPTDDKSSTKDRVGVGTLEDESPVSVDAFELVKEGLDPKVEEKLKKEEANAEKETAETPVVDEGKGVEKVEQDTKSKEPENKEEAKSEDKSDSLIHLELGISPGAVNHFKNMNRAAREWITSELKTRYGKINELSAKVKDLETKRQADTGDGNNLPQSWYEHPDAVKLLPAYQTIVGQAGQVKSLLEHYHQQKIAIAEGDVWEALEQDAQGKWGRKAYKADAAATAFVDDKIAELRAIESQLYRKAEEIQTNYKQNAIRTREQVVALEDQYFPQYKDSKELETNENWKAIRGILEKFGLSQDRLSGVTAKMYVYTMSALAENDRLTKELEETKKKLTAAPGVKKGNGPTGDEINRGATKKTYDNPEDEPVDIDIFTKRLNGEL